MYAFPIGAMLDSFKTDIKTAIQKAAAVGATGVQLYATRGDHSPEKLTPARKKEILSMMQDSGLVFSALCGDFGQGFCDREKNPVLIEKSKRILDLAKEFGTDVVTTHIGVVPEDPSHDRYKIMQEACFSLSQYADSLNAHFAIETGPEPAKTLKTFLDSLGSTGVAVNLDPANLVMVTGDDPVQAVYTLKDYIVHTHAKDGHMLSGQDIERLYGQNADTYKGRRYIELPLGEGDVDFPNYLKALDEIGYKGFLTIEREVGDDPAADIQKAADFLRKTIQSN